MFELRDIGVLWHPDHTDHTSYVLANFCYCHCLKNGNFTLKPTKTTLNFTCCFTSRAHIIHITICCVNNQPVCSDKPFRADNATLAICHILSSISSESHQQFTAGLTLAHVQ